MIRVLLVDDETLLLDSLEIILSLNQMEVVAKAHDGPAVIEYTTGLAASINEVTSACADADVSVQTELLIQVSDLLSDMKVALSKLAVAEETAAAQEGTKEKAHKYHDEVVPAMEALRRPADELERLVDRRIWPFPTYGDLVFEV